jgi:hypothetical protein
MTDEEFSGYELVMPFVVVTSVGGPFDDNAFAAGWTCGQVDTQLAAKPAELALSGYTNLREQFDLIAMKHGYQLQTDVVAPEGDETEWTVYKFTLNDWVDAP